MEGAGILTLALLVFGVPYALFKLLVVTPYGLFNSYKIHLSRLGPREAALQEAAHGAAMIVLPLLVLLRYGAVLPPYSALAALVVVICGGFRLYNGAKFSVGWRDPKLLGRAAIKIVLAVLLFQAIDQRQWWIDPTVDAVGDGLLSLLGWFLLVTGTTKLFLVLRGLPGPVFVNPGGQYGKAGFWNPKQKGSNK